MQTMLVVQKAEGYGYVGKAIALAFQSLFSAGGAKSQFEL